MSYLKGQLLIVLSLSVVVPVADASEVTDEYQLTDNTWSYYAGPNLLPANWYLEYERYLTSGNGDIPIGYGDEKLETEIWSTESGEEPYPAAYFAQTFRWSESEGRPDPTHLRILLECDDGCVLYLNRVEVVRNRMPLGEIVPYSAFVLGDENGYEVVSLPISVLRQGLNQVAVEVHQVSPGSSDLRFNTRFVVE